MKSRIYQLAKYILIGVLVIITACCVSVVIRNTYIKLERQNCYARVSEELGVEPTVQAIWEAYDAQLSEKLVPDMHRDQVMEELEQIATVFIFDFGSLPEGGYAERVRLRICSIYENDIQFLFRYTKEDLLMNFTLYYDD